MSLGILRWNRVWCNSKVLDKNVVSFGQDVHIWNIPTFTTTMEAPFIGKVGRSYSGLYPIPP